MKHNAIILITFSLEKEHDHRFNPMHIRQGGIDDMWIDIRNKGVKA